MTLEPVEGASTATCAVCGTEVLVEPAPRPVGFLWHYQDGSHEYLPSPTGAAAEVGGPVRPEAILGASLLLIAARLGDLAEDLRAAVADLDRIAPRQ